MKSKQKKHEEFLFLLLSYKNWLIPNIYKAWRMRGAGKEFVGSLATDVALRSNHKEGGNIELRNTGISRNL